MTAPKGNKFAKKPDHLRRRVYRNARFEAWFCDWLDIQSNRGRLIQKAVMKVYDLKPPKDGE